MGTIKKGILGGFSGIVGTVVGASWKGIPYMRSLPQKVRDARSEKQISQRTKFGLVTGLLKPMAPLLRTGWKLYADRQSPYNAATSYMLANAITGVFPDYAIDESKVLISSGSLTPAADAKAIAAGKNIEISWNDNSGVGSAKQTDTTLVAVVNTAKREAATYPEGAERVDETQTVVIPADWSGDSVDVYLGFISEDGREVANSVYLGNITIA